MPRLSFELAPDEMLCALRQLYDALDDEEQTHEVFLETLLEPLESVQEHTCGWIEQLDALLGELTADRRDCPLELHIEPDEDDFFESFQIGISTDDLPGWSQLRRFARLLDHLDEAAAHGYRLRVYLGGRRSTLEIARARIDEALGGNGGGGGQRQRRRQRNANAGRRRQQRGGGTRRQAGGGRYGGLGEDGANHTRQQQQHRARTEQAYRAPREELVEAFCCLAGVDFPCPATDVDRAYRRAAFRHHPDRNPGDPEANARFILLTQAYQRCRELAQQRV